MGVETTDGSGKAGHLRGCKAGALIGAPFVAGGCGLDIFAGCKDIYCFRAVVAQPHDGAIGASCTYDNDIVATVAVKSYG